MKIYVVAFILYLHQSSKKMVSSDLHIFFEEYLHVGIFVRRAYPVYA